MLQHIYPVVVNLLEVFVDSIVARQHDERREHQVEEDQRQHVGDIVPVTDVNTTKNSCKNTDSPLH